MKFEINLNDYVEVVLTERGAYIYNERYKDIAPLLKYAVEKKQEGDVLRDQLWHLFEIFGPHISLGEASPFAMCIISTGRGDS